MAPSQTASSVPEDEDDYLTMTFDDPATLPQHESLTQRKKRRAREAEERARPKSKAELAEEERAKREAALNKTSMDTSSKGFKMMQRLGYKQGSALGVDRASNTPSDTVGESGTRTLPKDDRLLEPVGLEIREGRSGIGADAEKKRKFREEFERMEGEDKKRKVDEGEFRERQMKEREEKRMDGQVWGAMKVAEKLDEEDEAHASSRPLSSVNVLWRGLVKDRLTKERDRRMRYDLHQSLSRLPTYDDPDEESEDKIAMGRKERLEEVDLELDQDDTELDEFEALQVEEKLEQLVAFLRTKWRYCFWCKFRYPDEAMEGCPGLTEADHD